jgi:tRNA(Ile)-lysidine synthase
VTNILLSNDWISRLASFKQLIVGFSGGLDSTVLLHALTSIPALHHRVQAVHINHGISPNALSWQKHCEQVCTKFNVSFIAEAVEFNRLVNIEEGARDARYAVFSCLLKAEGCLLLGHHLDDQAETLLLQLFRGAGIDGLAGMQEQASFDKGALARPFLTRSREQLQHYAIKHGLSWIEDESNLDIDYSRNYVRQQIMPLLIKKWPGVVGNLARTASHCQQAQVNLYEQAIQDCSELEQDSLLIEPLKKLSYARLVNVLRVWFRNLKIKAPSTAIIQRIIHEIIWSRADAMPLVSWNQLCIRRYQGRIYFEQIQKERSTQIIEWPDFPKPLLINELGTLYASKAKTGLNIPDKARISIRFRQGGECMILHQQTKKLKKLFQEWNIPTWSRDLLPLLYINEELAAVIGYSVSDLFYAEEASQPSTSYPIWNIAF